MKNFGPCDRFGSRCSASVGANLSNVGTSTGLTGSIFKKDAKAGQDLGEQVTSRCSNIICTETRWIHKTLCGLSPTKQTHNCKQVSIAVNDGVKRPSHRRNHFQKLELKDGYHLLQIKGGDEWKTSFRTRYAHYDYKVMPFGLVNAPATFQAMMNTIFKKFLDDGVVVYLDDILIYSKNEEEHVELVKKLLVTARRLRPSSVDNKISFPPQRSRIPRIHCGSRRGHHERKKSTKHQRIATSKIGERSTNLYWFC